MPVLSIPESYFPGAGSTPELLVYNFRMTHDVIKSKVQLSMHMFSFLQTGRKLVHIEDACIAVDSRQSLLIRNGNALWTELPDTSDVYCCKLLFFNEASLQRFLNRHPLSNASSGETAPYFVIENDGYLQAYIQTLDTILEDESSQQPELLELKFNEVLVYLYGKYGGPFLDFLHSLIANTSSGFRQIAERHVHTALKLREIAFLCNMSLSTFKRHFLSHFGQNPGQWYKDRRLQLAHEILAAGTQKSSQIYLELGYNNLSNFSAAFKHKFGTSPRGLSRPVAD